MVSVGDLLVLTGGALLIWLFNWLDRQINWTLPILLWLRRRLHPSAATKPTEGGNRARVA